MFYLGQSPASAVVNLTQTAMVADAILGGRYGFAKSASALMAASKDVIRGHNEMCEAVDRGMVMTDVRVLEKHGGKSGDWTASIDK